MIVVVAGTAHAALSFLVFAALFAEVDSHPDSTAVRVTLERIAAVVFFPMTYIDSLIGIRPSMLEMLSINGLVWGAMAAAIFCLVRYFRRGTSKVSSVGGDLA